LAEGGLLRKNTRKRIEEVLKMARLNKKPVEKYR
jgi:hypothetical protein